MLEKLASVHKIEKNKRLEGITAKNELSEEHIQPTQVASTLASSAREVNTLHLCFPVAGEKRYARLLTGNGCLGGEVHSCLGKQLLVNEA